MPLTRCLTYACHLATYSALAMDPAQSLCYAKPWRIESAHRINCKGHAKRNAHCPCQVADHRVCYLQLTSSGREPSVAHIAPQVVNLPLLPPHVRAAGKDKLSGHVSQSSAPAKSTMRRMLESRPSSTCQVANARGPNIQCTGSSIHRPRPTLDDTSSMLPLRLNSLKHYRATLDVPQLTFLRACC